MVGWRNAATHLVFNWKHPRAEQQPSTPCENASSSPIEQISQNHVPNETVNRLSAVERSCERGRRSVRQDATSASRQREREIEIEIEKAHPPLIIFAISHGTKGCKVREFIIISRTVERKESSPHFCKLSLSSLDIHTYIYIHIRTFSFLLVRSCRNEDERRGI